MQQGPVHLVGSILERKPRATPLAPSPKPASGKTGFPAVQHRSQSAFARSREQQKRTPSARSQQVPAVQNVHASALEAGNGNTDDWREQIDEENRRRVEAMSEEEREEERREILQRFGPSVSETLRKVRELREKKRLGSERRETEGTSVTNRGAPDGTFGQNVKLTSALTSSSGKPSRPSSPPSAMSRGGTRPSSRADRSVRFADITSKDIHVYESAPPSPRRRPLALPPPSDADGPTISLGEWAPTSPSVRRREQGPFLPDAQSPPQVEEGTPEDIRRRFFPTALANDPSLAWMEPSSDSPATPSTLRFDLTGAPIPPDVSAVLPTHLGLHHHAEGVHAGYSLDELFLLSRSTVPAQRAAIIGVLAHIARRLKNGKTVQLSGQDSDLRKRIMAAGIEALAERGSVGARAVEVLWECIVNWHGDVTSIQSIELETLDGASEEDPISTLPLEYILSQASSALAIRALPGESLTQWLAILHRLGQHSNAIANSIVSTSGLVASVVQAFLLTPIPPSCDSPLPDPFALELLVTLALASRVNASALLGPADALLRYVTTLPTVSSYPLHLAVALLTGTLRLYTAFASYGLYAHVATTAAEHFSQIGRYIASAECTSKQLRETWYELLAAWMVCARDPHRTTPSHDILWSQVVGWDWGEEVLETRRWLTAEDHTTWAAIWRAEAAWLEGVRVNEPRSGQEARSTALGALQAGFQSGVEKDVVERSHQMLGQLLDSISGDSIRSPRHKDLITLNATAGHASALAAVMRLWLSCLPPQLSEPPESPPFILPFSKLSSLCSQVTLHPIWASVFSSDVPYTLVFCRPLALLLSSYLELSRQIPGITQSVWIAQAFSITLRLLPGDEEDAQRNLGYALDLITADFVNTRSWDVPAIIWEKGGMQIVKPFLDSRLQPKEEISVGPIWISPRSIAVASTQRLPPAQSLIPDARHNYPLPLAKDWLSAPIDSLLRSGDSDVFKSLPLSWDASESEVVRLSLLLAKIHREILCTHGMHALIPSREETLFTCMKVFMLEHGQQQNDSTEEVFRDAIVGRLMDELVAPFAAGTTTMSLQLPSPEIPAQNLESVAKRFLGPSTPFYQFYTDFVGLYDAISFAHPLFARLLLPPLSMRYSLDYRKYLWADYAHVLKTIRIPVDAVLTGSIGEYLWPVEGDAEVLGSYLRALIRGLLDGVLRFIAVHHIACNIWSDLNESVEDDKGKKLLQTLVDQAGFDAIREVVCYRQVQAGMVLVPPTCFAQVGDWKSMRLEFVKRTGGNSIYDRLKALLEN
ncbi:uncharacterized protein FIBRA_07971 [Fibroporia radiculosa]|uniref:RNA polymerase II-associated protein 1 C-terminal domain-containing protein n=1 Tax=Fibroporia radiculosa TaxID=599839 RepID=J4H4X3_9APHY|nr:uncharacterized protein FIBRA_07971 [Fibroporia radiculosa]CCM05739.1 predicted protein [Fibroporia radiculosa]